MDGRPNHCHRWWSLPIVLTYLFRCHRCHAGFGRLSALIGLLIVGCRIGPSFCTHVGADGWFACTSVCVDMDVCVRARLSVMSFQLQFPPMDCLVFKRRTVYVSCVCV